MLRTEAKKALSPFPARNQPKLPSFADCGSGPRCRLVNPYLFLPASLQRNEVLCRRSLSCLRWPERAAVAASSGRVRSPAMPKQYRWTNRGPRPEICRLPARCERASWKSSFADRILTDPPPGRCLTLDLAVRPGSPPSAANRSLVPSTTRRAVHTGWA